MIILWQCSPSHLEEKSKKGPKRTNIISSNDDWFHFHQFMRPNKRSQNNDIKKAKYDCVWHWDIAIGQRWNVSSCLGISTKASSLALMALLLSTTAFQREALDQLLPTGIAKQITLIRYKREQQWFQQRREDILLKKKKKSRDICHFVCDAPPFPMLSKQYGSQKCMHSF